MCAHYGTELNYTSPDEIEISDLPVPAERAFENTAEVQANTVLTGFLARLPLLPLLQFVFGILFFEVIQ